MADYAETLLQAVEILINKKIEEVKFDETINATVVDDSKADNGEYIVETEGAKFTAYSTEVKYKVNDSVLVTIPQGNYENQKIIVGKRVNNLDTPLVYQSPLEKIVNLTTNLIEGAPSHIENNEIVQEPELALWANDNSATRFLWDVDDREFQPTGKTPWWSWSIPTATSNNNEEADIWNSKIYGYQNYTRIGLQAQFSTWLGQYLTTKGNYGLALVVTFAFENQSFKKTLILDSNEFFGDVYDYETYFTQTKVFDLSEYADLNITITGLDLYVYQRSNFYDIYNSPIPSPSDNDLGITSLVPNIFVKDPMICLGIDTAEFGGDYASLEVKGSSIYRKKLANLEAVTARDAANERQVRIHWIHKDDTSGLIQLVEDDNMPTDYEIRWYRYRLGNASPDEFAGAHWERLTHNWNTTPEADGSYNLDSSEDAFTNHLEIVYKPDVNSQTSAIKAIVVRIVDGVESLCCSTKIFTFTNETEVRNNATILDTNTLTIRYEDGSGGNYFIYNRAGEISDAEDFHVHQLTAIFDPDITKNLRKRSPLNLSENDTDTVTWRLRNAQHSMIKIGTLNDEEEFIPVSFTNGGDAVINGEVDIYYTIDKHLSINKNYNTISLEAHKDGQDFSTSTTMFFGSGGTSGSDYKLSLTWGPDDKALNLNAERLRRLTGEVTLRDMHNELIPIPASATLELEWISLAGNNVSASSATESRELYYPIFQADKLEKVSNGNLPNYLLNPQENEPTYQYDLTHEAFQPISSGTPSIMYQKASGQTKLDFVPIKTLLASGDNASGTIGTITLNGKNERVYYYDTVKRLFVKHKDIFIIDPWDEYNEAEVYYEPVITKEKVYNNNNFLQYNKSYNNGVYNVTITPNQASDNASMDGLYILRLTLKNFGDYDLVEQSPIPLKWDTATRRINTVEGTASVRYATTGEIDFAKLPYRISALKQRNGEWAEYTDDATDGNFKLDGYWKLLYHLDSGTSASSISSFLPSLHEQRRQTFERALSFQSNNTPTYYIKTEAGIYQQPELQPDENNFSAGTYYILSEKTTDFQSYSTTEEFTNSPTLQPPGVYFKDAPLYGVQFCVIENDTPVVLWTQPILVYQDNYPSTTLNKWNGKTIETDEGQGTIVANGFAAGKKESDNTFTGVVLGDWSRSDIDAFVTKQTGVYGFNHGAMSYALKDDGTAFFGKDGSGRIYFNGNSAQIYSAGWIANKNDKKGMLIDVDDGYIKMIGVKNNNNENSIDTTEVVLSSNTSPYFKIGLSHTTINNDDTRTTTSNQLIKIGDNEYFLQSKDFSTESGAEAGVRFDLGTGQLKGYSFDIEATRTNEQVSSLPTYTVYSWNTGDHSITPGAGAVGNTYKIEIKSSDSTYPLKIGGSAFRVGWNGVVDATGGNFNNLTTSSASITNAQISNISASNFYATSGSFTGAINATSGNFSGSVNAGSYLSVGYISTGKGVIGDFTSDTDHIGMKFGNANSSGTGYVSCYASTVDLGPAVTIHGSLSLASVTSFAGCQALLDYLDGYYKRK